MISISKHFIQILFSFCVLFITIIISSYFFYPDPICIDSCNVSQTLFSVEPRIVVLGRWLLRESPNNVIIIGASNARDGFRPEIIKESIPEYNIHNVSVGAAKIYQTNQILSLLTEYIEDMANNKSEQDKKNVFVLAFWYWLFFNTENRLINGDIFTRKDTEKKISNEMIRFKLYKQKSQDLFEPIVPIHMLENCVTLLRPYMFIDKLTSKLPIIIGSSKKVLREYLTKKLNNEIVDNSLKGKPFCDGYTEEDDSIFVNKSLFLQNIANLIKHKENYLIIVDLPIPQWHSDCTKYFNLYQKEKTQIINDLLNNSNNKASYINLQDMNDNSDFRDGTHPTPSAAEKWSLRLGEELNFFFGESLK